MARSDCASALAGLHNAGLAFRDNPADHLLLVEQSESAMLPYWVDLGELFAPRRRQDRWRLYNLAAMADTLASTTLSRTDKYRCLCAYHQATGASESPRQLLNALGRV